MRPTVLALIVLAALLAATESAEAGWSFSYHGGWCGGGGGWSAAYHGPRVSVAVGRPLWWGAAYRSFGYGGGSGYGCGYGYRGRRAAHVLYRPMRRAYPAHVGLLPSYRGARARVYYPSRYYYGYGAVRAHHPAYRYAYRSSARMYRSSPTRHRDAYRSPYSRRAYCR